MGVSPAQPVYKIGKTCPSQDFGPRRGFFLFKCLPGTYCLVLRVAGCPGKAKQVNIPKRGKEVEVRRDLTFMKGPQWAIIFILYHKIKIYQMFIKIYEVRFL